MNKNDLKISIIKTPIYTFPILTLLVFPPGIAILSDPGTLKPSLSPPMLS
jgi:hypothetical protein